MTCRPLCEGVDWNFQYCLKKAWQYCRPLCEGVDWNCLCHYIAVFVVRSPSLRGRGLKYTWIPIHTSGNIVALFARAWIEICKRVWEPRTAYSRPLCEGVDWNIQIISTNLRYEGRPLCEGVDWNVYIISDDTLFNGVALFARAWIEIHHCSFPCSLNKVALFARAWIEIFRTMENAV